ncbi:hypothetical protein CR513_36474, partial [Mucuna pruriens]
MQHWNAVKCVMHYLRRTKGYMLTYWKSEGLEFIGYSDFNFVGCEDNKHSISRYIYMLPETTISWNPFNHGCRVCGLLRGIQPWDMAVKLCYYFRVVNGIERLLKIYYDNNWTIFYSNNNRNSTKLKFINIKFLFVKERVQNK